MCVCFGARGRNGKKKTERNKRKLTKALVLPKSQQKKIQSVFPLRDGSALFVTVARYLTPSEDIIDGVGIRPENACRGGSGGSKASSATLLASLEMVPGVAREAGALQASLSADECVLTAERLLLEQLHQQQQQEQGDGGTRL